MTATPLLRILIADDHDIMREGTRTVIERQAGWEVCGTAATGREAIAQAIQLKPDIVVMDMSMPDLNGLDAAVQIKRRLPGTEILMFSGHATEQLIREVFAAGIKSFINKAEAQTYLMDAIESLSQHKPFFTDKVSEILFSAMFDRAGKATDDSHPAHELSARERQIVQLLAEGNTNKEIGQALGISVRTAETHRASILHKLKLTSVADLVRYAIRNKIIEA